MQETARAAMAIRLRNLGDVRRFAAQHITDAGVDLLVHQTGATVPFEVQRVFTVHVPVPVERGCHAHKRCAQVMVCLRGGCAVTVDDGNDRKIIELNRPQDALYVPASIWAEQTYLEAGSILMVLCDQPYDETDYIRDYAEFLAWRGGTQSA